MNIFIFLAFFLGFLLPTFGQTSRPNIVVFLVDDMGWQDTSEPFWQCMALKA